MLPRLLRTRVPLQSWRSIGRPVVLRRTLVAPPKPGDSPFMERRADRELPEIPKGGMKWVRTIPVFLVILVSSTLAIFNYQKSSSSVVSSNMYALRTSPKAREYLGDNIYFAQQMPWIWGEINQLHGRIDIQFDVKGTRNSGTMRFKSFRATRMGMFETTEWSLETTDGRKIDLLDGEDVFKTMDMLEEPKVVGRGSYAPNLSG
ncbi:hypothetical protein BP6252_03201 [Coleophoma cylindrospora]|uniref:DUF1783-domain-containing protein n=1 Tax=Coleophoma cylindrospora TaxID=1849047 RepID=A0A3D8S730_9HELO|nr:hypothetical protein BP6252_03201 [Coleophoma cylindrospora]